jgi:hypothetical protein
MITRKPDDTKPTAEPRPKLQIPPENGCSRTLESDGLHWRREPTWRVGKCELGGTSIPIYV